MPTDFARRGRPRGSGLDDRVSLRAIADLLEADPALKPTTAIKRIGVSDPSTIRRLRDKLRQNEAEATLSVAEQIRALGRRFIQVETFSAQRGRSSAGRAIRGLTASRRRLRPRAHDGVARDEYSCVVVYRVVCAWLESVFSDRRSSTQGGRGHSPGARWRVRSEIRDV